MKGTILPYGDNGHFYVGIGQKSDALLPKKDAGELQPGDEAEFLVVSDGDSDECVTLSFTRLQHAREVESAWSSLKQLEASGDVTDVVIIGVEKRKDDDRISGLKASFRGLLKGFIPLSLVQSNQPAGELVGSTVSVKVLKAEDKGRFSNILFSNKGASEALVASAIASLEVGTIVTGTVTKIMLEKKDARNEAGPRRETGVLVEFLPGVSGFVHKSNISEMDGLGRRMPVTYAAFFLASLSIIGMPPLGGFLSNWSLVVGGIDGGRLLLVAVVLVSSLLNAAYFFPIVYRGFFAAAADGTGRETVREAPLLCLVPLSVTALFCLALFVWPSLALELIQKVVSP